MVDESRRRFIKYMIAGGGAVAALAIAGPSINNFLEDWGRNAERNFLSRKERERVFEIEFSELMGNIDKYLDKKVATYGFIKCNEYHSVNDYGRGYYIYSLYEKADKQGPSIKIKNVLESISDHSTLTLWLTDNKNVLNENLVRISGTLVKDNLNGYYDEVGPLTYFIKLDCIEELA